MGIEAGVRLAIREGGKIVGSDFVTDVIDDRKRRAISFLVPDLGPLLMKLLSCILRRRPRFRSGSLIFVQDKQQHDAENHARCR